MLALISPAKTLDPAAPVPDVPHSQPMFPDQTRQLVELLRGFDEAALATLMGLSPALARLNWERFQDFSRVAPPIVRPAAALYRGDTYTGLAVDDWSREDWAFAQGHVRILSGLYGLLRPLDLIQPYRLEMGVRLANPAGKDLYAFWGGRLAEAVTKALVGHEHPLVVNLASEEYAKAVSGLPMLTPVFQEARGDRLQVIGLMAKRARGAMARFMVTRRLTAPEGLRDFNEGGYAFREALSDGQRWVFVREGRG